MIRVPPVMLPPEADRRIPIDRPAVRVVVVDAVMPPADVAGNTLVMTESGLPFSINMISRAGVPLPAQSVAMDVDTPILCC